MAPTLPLPCDFTAFVAKTLPVPCDSTAFVAKTLPVPCDSTAFVAKNTAFVLRSHWTASRLKTLPLSCIPTGRTECLVGAQRRENTGAAARDAG